MKKSYAFITLFIVILIVFSCKKDGLTLTGKWNTTFTIGSDDFNGIMTLSQDKDDKLSGDFEFSDGSGLLTLLSTSKVDGATVYIEMMLDAYKMTYKGTINSDFDYMNGKYYVDGSYIGDWSAEREPSEKSYVIDSNNSDRELLLELLTK